MEAEDREFLVRSVTKEIGLSPYLLSVFYDFYEHRLYTQKESARSESPRSEKHKERLVAVVCPNPDICPIRKKPSENEIRSLLKEYEQSLGKMEHLERDEMMVAKFLGWAQTHSGHFVMVQYHGFTRERKELVKLSNWSPLHKKYLVLFHSRFSKDRSLSLPLGMNYTDLEESGDGRGNLSLDTRFVVNKWFDSATDLQKSLLMKHRGLFEKRPNYLIKQFGQNSLQKRIMSLNQVKADSQSVPFLITPILSKLTPLKKEAVKWDESDEDEDDPYQIKEEKYRIVSKDEYSQKLVIHKDMHFTLHDYTEASRASFLSKKHTHSLEYYTFDPIHLVDAACIGLHMEGQMKRACSQIPLKHLQVVQNNDMIPILNFFAHNKHAKEDLKRYYEEYIYALMCLENTTSHLPPQVSASLNNIFEELSMSQGQ